MFCKCVSFHKLNNSFVSVNSIMFFLNWNNICLSSVMPFVVLFINRKKCWIKCSWILLDKDVWICVDK
jgi:hypothetical protein